MRTITRHMSLFLAYLSPLAVTLIILLATSVVKATMIPAGSYRILLGKDEDLTQRRKGRKEEEGIVEERKRMRAGGVGGGCRPLGTGGASGNQMCLFVIFQWHPGEHRSFQVSVSKHNLNLIVRVVDPVLLKFVRRDDVLSNLAGRNFIVGGFFGFRDQLTILVEYPDAKASCRGMLVSRVFCISRRCRRS